MRSSLLVIIIVTLIIAVFSISSVYSTTYQKESKAWQDIYKRQILWFAIGFLIFLLAAGMNYRRLWDVTYILYGVVIFFLILVDVLGITRLGAQRWLKIGAFNFQPSEFAKLAVVVFLARYYSRKSSDSMQPVTRNKGFWQSLGVPFLFTVVPIGLIIEQPDLGSGLILFFIFVAMVYAAGVRLKHLGIFIACCLLPLPVFWQFLRDYQKDRIFVFLNPDRDPLGAGYTVIQSKIAVGSGGFFGKGWLSGTQSQLHFLPESHTDFIFATFAEQWGFAGSAILLVLYYVLIRQGLLAAQRTHDQFGRLLGMGIAFMLFIQMSVNIAMNMGFAPVVGVPLPMMSYGGSSVVVSLLALGILVNIDRTRAVF